MKSGLRDRNNQELINAGADLVRTVSMKSGLRDRNNMLWRAVLAASGLPLSQ